MNNTSLLSKLSVITQRSDLMIAVLLVAVVFMMILPLPTLLVDFLIAMNMCIAMVLLMVAVYLTTPLEFIAFPSVLLITTIFRLALSITTTRLILLEADAGKIIETFGNFVVGGNLIVGLVIFLIITIVQFLVITKGSERVAEVSARFSLDGMPGKQMSIDSDMRAGLIDMEQARQRRQNVEKESQLFGSMDGAMKFVKGDAIAGIIIICVNILGGVSIGVFQNGLSAGEALELYSILTIGDGLIAQIPALIISVTSGIIVTRVTTEESKDLGADIRDQIAKKPDALMVGGFLMLGFAVIPGFPTAVFLMLAALIGGGGFLINFTKKKQLEEDDESGLITGDAEGGTKTDKDGKKAKQSEFELTVPLIVEVADSAQRYISYKVLNQEITNIRKALYMDLGAPFPGIQLRFTKTGEQDHYSILLQETPISRGEFKEAHVLVLDQRDQLELLELPVIEAEQFLPGRRAYWVSSEYVKQLQEAEVPFMELPKILSFHLSLLMKRYAHEFVGIQEAKQILAQVEDTYDELVKEVQRLLPLQKIADIFQRLLSEEISIRNLRIILESLVEWGQKEKETVMLTEYVRVSLKRYISYKYSNGQNILPAYMLDQDVEDVIRNGIRQTSAGAYLALDPPTSQKIMQAITAAIGDINMNEVQPVLVVSMDVRRYVRKMVEAEYYELPVLSFQELTNDITVQPLKRIEIS